MRRLTQFLLIGILILYPTVTTRAEEAAGKYTKFDLKIKELAVKCRDEVTARFQALLASKTLTVGQLFDTFYIPIPNTQPQKYQTSYDRITDHKLRDIFDRYTGADPNIIFVVAVDRNGYLPTHISKFSKPTANNSAYNVKNNRTKQIFNDRTGLAAARNLKPFLLQRYQRDTGDDLYDLSVPIMLNGRHWGAIRISYTQKK